MSYIATYPNNVVLDRNIGHEGRVRYGTSTEQWHSLAPWYSVDTSFMTGRGLGLNIESAVVGGGVTAVGIGGLLMGGLVGWYACKTFGGGDRYPVYRNRRRRRR